MPRQQPIHRLLILALLAALLPGCGTPDADEAMQSGAPEPTLTPPKTGLYQATISVPGGDIPFQLDISDSPAGLRAMIINGDERIAVPAITLNADRVQLAFPAFNNRIDAKVSETGLTGTLTLVKRYGKTQVMPFSASAAPAIAQADDAQINVSGRWAVEFVDEDAERTPAIGEFSQTGATLTGTFLTETGDYRYLNGHVSGDELTLSTFDGAHAFLFRATLREDTLSGQFWSGTEWLETWSGKRDDAAQLRDMQALTYLNPGFERLEFTFDNQYGQPVSLADSRYEGKVVIVTLVGTWCPNCHDETQVMRELYDRYHADGLEIIALMYEHLEDEQAAWQQVEYFRDKFALQYDTLLAGISDKALAAETLPALNHILAFPTAIFIDRNGAVRDIHTGFSGPGTGEHYTELVATIDAKIQQLLAEPAGPSNDTVAAITGAP